ncbi:MAG: hypothetical protein NC078_05350 [Ruminococcus sp.]|nr:hypothetical protein [Ruminococcus sp.]
MNRLLLNTFREVKKSPGRFAAITAIIAISCAFYSGVKAAAPDMKSSAARYYDEYSLADIQIKSTLGFAEEDIDVLLGSGSYTSGYAGYSADLFTDGFVGQAALKVMSYSEEQPLNGVRLTEGRMPENPGECLADDKEHAKISFGVGDKIVLAAPEGEELSDYVNREEFTVVGLVSSPVYVKFDRGATSIGNGSLDAFIYISPDDFAYETYTDIYLSAAGTKGIDPFSDEYDRLTEAGKKYAEDISAERLEVRADSLRFEAEEELAEAREDLAEGQDKLADGKKEYSDGLRDVADAEAELEEQRENFEEGEKEYNDALAELEENELNMTHLSETCARVDKFLADYDGVYLKVLPDGLLGLFKEIQDIYDANSIDADIEDLMAVYIITDPDKSPRERETARITISTVNEQVREASAAALYQIAVSKDVLAKTGEEIEAGREELEKYEKELEDAKKDLAEAEKELAEAQEEIDDANKEIANAEQELEDIIEKGEWYVWDRSEWNPDCSSYGKDAERLDAIASVFPIFFILIAALVCCTTMSRMVEEQRTQTGTLKALGYSGFDIIMQYVLYAVAASVIGSVGGTLIGMPLLPRIFYICYESMYAYPYFETPIKTGYLIGCMGVSVLCTVLSAVYTAGRELTGTPAVLIRPKPPKDGKRILLEKIGFIWNRMKFTHKVTFRNLMRYKSRFFMTLIGIGGCTALLLTGYGLKTAISCIVDKQYSELWLYDAMAVVEEELSEEDSTEIENALAARSEITGYMRAFQETKDVWGLSGENVTGYIFAPDVSLTADSEDMSDYIVLRDRKTHEPINILTLGENEAVINEKLALLLGVSKGDEITVEDGSEPLKVAAITENYTFHYVYMNTAAYKKLFGNNAPDAPNMILINTGDTPEKSVRDEISAELIACDGVISASFTYDGTDSFRKLVSSLNLIVIVIILFAGLLAFVILYNLANININERVRELATIKVLGFFDGEVGAYIYRENTISAVVGMAAGLVLGIFFESFVIRTAEVDEVMFSPEIPPECFVLAAVTMAAFTVIVNAILYFRLKKIDMTSSMKAIE